MQTITPLISRPALGAAASKTIHIELVREPSLREFATVYARARLDGDEKGRDLRDLTAAEIAGFRKAGRAEIVGIIGMVGVNAVERGIITAAIEAQLDGVAGSPRRPIRVPVATQADYADDAEVQAAWATAQQSGERAFVKTWLEDVDRPDIESNQEFVDLYVELTGKLSVTVRPLY